MVAEAGRPRVIQMNDDSVTFFSYCKTERPTAKDLEDMVDVFAMANVDTLTYCAHCRWQAAYDSKVVEVAGDLVPEAVRPWEHTHYWQWHACLRRLIAEGNDPPEVLARRCHERGMNFLPSFRLNDQHGMLPHEGQYGSFRRDHPEWIIGDKAMDYGVPEVREHILMVVRELTERYDLDGIDLDFMRWPICFRDDQVQANVPLMTGFVGEVRSILDGAGKRRGRHMLLSVRVPLNIGDGSLVNPHPMRSDIECLGVGLDVRAWVREGLIDVVCPMNFFYTDWHTMIANMDEWRELTDGTQCGLYPTIHSMALDDYTPPYVSAESYRGAAHSYYLHGADGIALYNLWHVNETGWGAVRDFGAPIVLGAQPRRYHCYLGDPIPIARGERKTVDFYLPEDPMAPSERATLRFSAVNLTLEHHMEVDVNGTPVDGETLLFERVGPSQQPAVGAPRLAYMHIVAFLLAGTAAVMGKNVLGVRLIEINPEVPGKETVDICRVEASFEPR